MVTGIDRSREHFAGHEGQWAIIGGAACDLLFDAAGLNFRVTKDIDMVLCVEVVDAEFGRAFHAFLTAGGYRARERNDGRSEFYRFHRPTDPSFPFMIELFARRPTDLNLPEDAIHTRMPVDEDIVSLSAILLDDAHFGALQAARRQINGVTIIDENLPIPFKARAVHDLTNRHRQGASVNQKDIRKHRNDVFRLAQLLPQYARVTLPGPIHRDIQSFVDMARADQSLDPRAFGVPFTRDEAVDLLRRVYEPPPATGS